MAPTVIGLGSQSQIKVDAAIAALASTDGPARLVPVKASSSINEQPFGDETVMGATARALHTLRLVPDASLAVAVESGLFERDGKWWDVAVAVAYQPGGVSPLARVDSAPVEFPADAVEETLRRGSHIWTAGKILAEWGIVTDPSDPHLDLCGTSRTAFIEAALRDLFCSILVGSQGRP